jgi:branched-chain amino acid transport system substrate-binding protein
MKRMVPLAAAVLFAATPVAAQIKIAYIDPLSGPFANVGEIGLAHFQLITEKINAAGGVLGGQRLEIVPFDNKASPQESFVAFQSAVDQGIRIITQGNGSGVAAALIDAVNKHNARNPDKLVVYLNYSAVDPDLTNAAKCSFWHFRFDANTEQKLDAMTDYLAKQKEVKKVFIIGQDYAHGQQIARIGEAMLKKKRPDITIVGNDLHPMGKVKDFAPYVAKIKSSGADAVITGNWGNDLSLLVKAARDAGLKIPFYTFYGGGLGTPRAVGEAGGGRVIQVTEWQMNLEPNKAEAYANEYNKKNTSNEFYLLRINNEMLMLAKAIDTAKALDPKKIALALEGMRFQGDAGEVWMRKEDHQLIQPLYISIFERVGTPGVKYAVEKTGYGFKTLETVPAQATEVPTTCQMQRP